MGIDVICIAHADLSRRLVHYLDELLGVQLGVPGVFGQVQALEVCVEREIP